jgi:hypothetical protein
MFCKYEREKVLTPVEIWKVENEDEKNWQKYYRIFLYFCTCLIYLPRSLYNSFHEEPLIKVPGILSILREFLREQSVVGRQQVRAALSYAQWKLLYVARIR